MIFFMPSKASEGKRKRKFLSARRSQRTWARIGRGVGRRPGRLLKRNSRNLILSVLQKATNGDFSGVSPEAKKPQAQGLERTGGVLMCPYWSEGKKNVFTKRERENGVPSVRQGEGRDELTLTEPPLEGGGGGEKFCCFRGPARRGGKNLMVNTVGEVWLYPKGGSGKW